MGVVERSGWCWGVRGEGVDRGGSLVVGWKGVGREGNEGRGWGKGWRGRGKE